MEKITQALQHSAKMLREDVTMFRQLILKSDGGSLPPEITEKQALVNEIEEALKRINELKPANS